MSEPNDYLVVRNLQTALSAIRVSDGYFYDLVNQMVKLDPNQDVETLISPEGPRPFIIVDVQPDDWDVTVSSRPNRVKIGLPINLHWVGDSDPTVDESWMQAFFRGCADVERAIAVDLSRGGLAFDTRVTQRTASHVGGNSSLVWAIIATRVTVSRVYGQP